MARLLLVIVVEAEEFAKTQATFPVFSEKGYTGLNGVKRQ